MQVGAQVWASGRDSFTPDAWRYVERLGWVVDVLLRACPQATATARCSARWQRETVGLQQVTAQ
ncbi:hypothetical protein [Nocardia wallacei]|uniref:hypothetical protein n=1 Tax=Nocardia wallacei TaxID=480035 RepID=UPI002455B722|nr:hypothetical protein [Nocardia wallacei]